MHVGRFASDSENDHRVWDQIEMFINASLRPSEKLGRASLAVLNEGTLQ